MTTDRTEDRRAIGVDGDGVIRRWGPECENVFGYSAEEALGHKLDLIVPPVLQARHWRGFHRAIDGGRLKRPGATLKVPAVHKRGAIVSIRLADAALTRADDGKVDGVVLTVLGPGSRWTAAGWKAVLAVLAAGQFLGERVRPAAGRGKRR